MHVLVGRQARALFSTKCKHLTALHYTFNRCNIIDTANRVSNNMTDGLSTITVLSDSAV